MNREVLKIATDDISLFAENIISDFSLVEIVYTGLDLIVVKITTPIMGEGAKMLPGIREHGPLLRATPVNHSVVQCSFFALHNGDYALLSMGYLSKDRAAQEKAIKARLVDRIRSDWGLLKKGASA